MSSSDLRVITPVPLTSANIDSTSVSEGEYSAWSSGTTYAVADYVISGHVIYISLQAANLNNAPASSAAWWQSVGPTNAYSMFDLSNSSVTDSAASTLTVVIEPGSVDALYTSGLEGVATVRVTEVDTSTSPPTAISDETRTLTGSTVTAWNGVFSTPSYTPQEASFDLTKNVNCMITVVYTGTNVKVATLAVGNTDTIGTTESGAQPGIRDFSRVEVDDFGVRTFTRRDYSKRMAVRLMIDNTKLNKIYQILAGLRATPCVWYATTTSAFEPLRMLGYYVDLNIEVTYADTSFCSLQVEGL